MDLQPLTRSVVSPDFVNALEQGGDHTGLAGLPLLKTVYTMEDLEKLMDEFTNEQWSPAAADERAMRLVVNAVNRMSPNDISDISALLAAYMAVGVQMVMVQMGYVMGHMGPNNDGHKSLSVSQKQFIDKILGSSVTALSKALPLPNITDCTQANGDPRNCVVTQKLTKSRDEYIVTASIFLVNQIVTQMGADLDIMSAYFPEPVIMHMIVCMTPYLTLSYYASFVPGPWNAILRPDVSFYDQRYAELIIYSSVADAIAALIAFNSQDNALVTQLTIRMNAVTITMMARSEAHTSGESMKYMYGHVADLSKRSRDSSIELSATTSRFERRREYTRSMMLNLSADNKLMKDARTKFRLWIATYVSVAAVAMLLIVIDKHTLFLLHTGITLFVVALYMLTGVVRGVLRPYTGVV